MLSSIKAKFREATLSGISRVLKLYGENYLRIPKGASAVVITQDCSGMVYGSDDTSPKSEVALIVVQAMALVAQDRSRNWTMTEAVFEVAMEHKMDYANAQGIAEAFETENNKEGVN